MASCRTQASKKARRMTYDTCMEQIEQDAKSRTAFKKNEISKASYLVSRYKSFNIVVIGSHEEKHLTRL